MSSVWRAATAKERQEGGPPSHAMNRTTFIAGLTLYARFGGTPTFGDVQAVLFPAYFWTQSLSSAAVLALTAAGRAGGGPDLRPRAVAAGAALATSLLNLTVLEPVTTARMYARRAADAGNDERAKKAARTRFGRAHGASSLANLVGLAGGVAWLWFVADSL